MPCFPICQRQCPNLIEAPRSRCRANGGFPCPASAIHRLMRGLTVAMLIFVALSALVRGQSRQFAPRGGACSDSVSRHPTPPKLAHPDCRLSERYGFHTIGNQRRALSISVRAPARNPPWLNPVPASRARPCVSSGRVQARIAGANRSGTSAPRLIVRDLQAERR